MPGFAFLKQLFQEFGRDSAAQLSAAFAYGALFSIGPLLLVLISVAGLVFGEQAVQGKLFSEISDTIGASTAKTIQDVVVHIHQSKSGLIALIIGSIGMLLSAAGITTQLQNSFNRILGVVPDPKGGIKRTIYVKFKNILLILIGGIVIAASVVGSAVIIGLGDRLRHQLGLPAITLEILNNLVSALILVMVLYGLYRVLPDLVVPRKIVLGAAIIVTILFLAGKIVLGIIIGSNGTASAYGAAASLITLLLWIYYSGQILFLGAEGIKLYGFNHSLDYAPKRLSLKRTTLHVDSSDLRGKLIESWLRGYRKHAPK